MMHRFLRLSAFLAGLLAGGLSVLFAFDNPARIILAVGAWQIQAVPLWTVALVPLVAGIAAGYLYHLPARMHHFGEHMKHRGLVHDLHKENEELSRTLDRLLAMPNDDSPAIAAAAAARDVTPAPGPQETLSMSLPVTTRPETVVIAAPPAPAEHASKGQTKGETNGRRPRRAERRPQARLLTAPEAMNEAIAAAAAAMPAERHARAVRPARARKPSPKQLDPN